MVMLTRPRYLSPTLMAPGTLSTSDVLVGTHFKFGWLRKYWKLLFYNLRNWNFIKITLICVHPLFSSATHFEIFILIEMRDKKRQPHETNAQIVSTNQEKCSCLSSLFIASICLHSSSCNTQKNQIERNENSSNNKKMFLFWIS